MGLRVVLAFAVASLVVLTVGGWLRSVARRHRARWVRQLGGLVLALTVPVGLAAAVAIPTRALVVCGAALVLALVGYLQDHYDLPRWVVPAVLVVAAGGVAATGVRFAFGGVPEVDVAWTLAWLVGVTWAVAGSGNADGQLPTLTAGSTLGVLALGAFAGQSALATTFAALLGGLVAFLAYNLRPASLYLGRSGALLVGFLIAAGAIWARPSIERPGSLVVNVLLVGVVLLDGAIVTVSRLRRRHRLTVRLRDHLAHRLVAGGMAPSRAIATLAAVQLLLAVVAVFVGRGVLAAGVGAALGALALVVLAAVGMRARMRDRAPGLSWRARLLVFGVLGLGAIAVVPAAISAFASRSHITTARDITEAAIQAARDGDSARAATLFASAEQEFAEADDSLGSALNVPSLMVPVFGSNLDAARKLARIGVDLARAGRELAQTIDTDRLRLVNGRVPLEEVSAIAPRLDQASRLLTDSQSRLGDIDRSYLLGEIDEGIEKLAIELAKAALDAEHAAAAARVAPFVLGQDEPRRYLLVVQNPAELRGTGGLVGNWGILTAANGTVRLESLDRVASLNAAGNPSARKLHAPEEYVQRYGRFDPARTWQSVNISPDFPTVGAIMADLFGQSLSPPVDGVLAVDPAGLGALLELTGPVRVPDWPTPVSAQNVVDVTLRDAYFAFARTPDRADFLGDVARAAVDRATSGDLGTPAQVGKVLGRAAHEGHIMLWFATRSEQRVADELGISGRMPAPAGDSLLVSNTNAGANKLDYYLQRSIDYSVTVTPSDDLRRALARGTVDVGLRNEVPASGVPQIAAGPYEGATDRFVYGQNHSFLSIYTPLVFTGARLDDREVGLEAATELDRNVYSTYVDAFSQRSAKVTLGVEGVVRLAEDGWYTLTLVRQPTVRADRVTVRVAVPEGFRILEVDGLEVVDGVAQGTLELTRTRTLRVRIGHDSGRNLWERLEDGT